MMTLITRQSISILSEKIEILFRREIKGISPLFSQQQPNMDYLAVAPLNAKGTCFRIIIVEPAAATKTPKHIKTKKL
jgi:hypothetical protein